MKKCLYLIVTASLFLMTGCASVGKMQHSTDTQVVLKGNNYKIIKAGVKGESSGFWLLGLIPIVSPNYADAKANLYENIGKSLEGKSVVLVNQTQDSSFLYLILFSIPRVAITADVVEFIDEPAIPQENKPVKE